MGELVFRFLIGGLIVSFFSVLGDIFKPKSFAGLFGAAPSVGLATIALTAAGEGRLYASTEARSMAWGAVAFLTYACAASRLMLKFRWHALSASLLMLVLWFCVALALWFAILR